MDPARAESGAGFFLVETRGGGFYCQRMKQICCLVLIFAGLVVVGSMGRAQDAATEERLGRLSGQIEDLITAHKNLQKQIREVAEGMDRLREQVNRPNAAYLTSEDLKPLDEKIVAVDRKRVSDAERIAAQLKEIQRLAASAPPPPRRTEKPVPERPEKGFEYEVQAGDTLSTIIAAYRDKNVKVTMDQVLKANPGLKPERMKVGQVIFIPGN